MGGNASMMGGNTSMMGGNANMMGGSMDQSMFGVGSSGQGGMGMNNSGRTGLPTMDDFRMGSVEGSSGMGYDVGSPSSSYGSETIKAVLCKTWMDEGACRNPSCNYAHGQKELNEAKAVMNQQPQESNKRKFQAMADEPRKLDGKYKVVMCDKGLENCTMGNNCHYAHGFEELYYY